MATAPRLGRPSASSLIIGALLGLARDWPDKLVGAVLAFGAGALISAISFDLAEEGGQLGGGDSLAIGLALGALTYFTAHRLVEPRRRPAAEGAVGGPRDAGRRPGAGARRVPRRHPRAARARHRHRRRGRRQRRPARGDLRVQPPRGGRLGQRDAAGQPRGTIVRLWLVAAVLHARDRRGLRDRRQRVGRHPGDHRRLRGRRAARDADRLDGPRGRAPRGRHRRPARPCSASRSPPRSQASAGRGRGSPIVGPELALVRLRRSTAAPCECGPRMHRDRLRRPTACRSSGTRRGRNGSASKIALCVESAAHASVNEHRRTARSCSSAHAPEDQRDSVARDDDRARRTGARSPVATRQFAVARLTTDGPDCAPRRVPPSRRAPRRADRQPRGGPDPGGRPRREVVRADRGRERAPARRRRAPPCSRRPTARRRPRSRRAFGLPAVELRHVGAVYGAFRWVMHSGQRSVDQDVLLALRFERSGWQKLTRSSGRWRAPCPAKVEPHPDGSDVRPPTRGRAATTAILGRPLGRLPALLRGASCAAASALAAHADRHAHLLVERADDLVLARLLRACA